jgi:hypothetical protein
MFTLSGFVAACPIYKPQFMQFQIIRMEPS